MKKIVLMALLATSPLTFAGTATSQCPNGYGDVTVQVDDQVIHAGTKVNALATFKLRDPAYPIPGAFQPEDDWCFDNDCKIEQGQSIPILPGGFQGSLHYSGLPTHPLTPGVHQMKFRIYLHSFDCSATTYANITMS